MSISMTAREGEFLLSSMGSMSLEEGTLASGEGSLVSGHVVGVITASGKLGSYDNTAADGTEVAYGVLLHATDATSADQKATVVRRLAEVATAKLDWHANNDAAAKTAGLTDMATNFIVARS